MPRFQHWLLLYFQAKAAVFKRLGTVLAVWFGTVLHSLWVMMLAPCQPKQNLIPSASKARPPLSNPMLSSLVVWSAHTALRPCVSPLGWKKMLLVGINCQALFMGQWQPLKKTKKQKEKKKSNKKKVTWSQSNQLLTVLKKSNKPVTQLACIYSQLMITEGCITYGNISELHCHSLWILKQRLSTSDHLHLCPIILK